MAATAEARCAALAWGNGPRVLDVFLEPTCPHSARAFGKLMPLLARAGEDRLTIRLTVHSQPWHLSSGLISRAILAASATEGGKRAAFTVMERVYAHRDAFEPADHCRGPNLDLSLSEMLRRIEVLSALELGAAFSLEAVTRAMARHARFARQNGVHVSPTFMVDGLIVAAMGSRDTLDSWLEQIGLAAIDTPGDADPARSASAGKTEDA
jgi:protein-disulfide isomerase